MAYQQKKDSNAHASKLKFRYVFFCFWSGSETTFIVMYNFFRQKKNSLHEALSAKCGSNIRDYKLLEAIKHPKRGRYDGKYTQGDSF